MAGGKLRQKSHEPVNQPLFQIDSEQASDEILARLVENILEYLFHGVKRIVILIRRVGC
jgi:hypothetical protein